jgi:hypothetical protein
MKHRNVQVKGPKRNELCPCDSGKKFGQCCAGQNFDWVKGEDNEWRKRTPLPPELVKMLSEQEKEFVELFGRKPSGNDPVFFKR